MAPPGRECAAQVPLGVRGAWYVVQGPPGYLVQGVVYGAHLQQFSSTRRGERTWDGRVRGLRWIENLKREGDGNVFGGMNILTDEKNIVVR